MDIHENEDHLGENEPMTPEQQVLEETPESDESIPEIVAETEPVVETEETEDPVEVEEVSQAEQPENPESDGSIPEVLAESEPVVETEETEDSAEVEEVSQEEQPETPESDGSVPEVLAETEPVVETEEIEDPVEVEEVSLAEQPETPESETTAVEAEEAPEIESEVGDLLEEVEPALDENVVAEEEPLPEIEVEADEGEPEPEEIGDSEDVQQEELPPDPYAAVSVSEEPIKEPEDGRAWYVVHCYSGNEDKVRHNIMQRIESMSMDDLIFDVVVPTEDEVNIKNGERQTVEKKVFPGYILVNMILTEESWYMVRNTPGVTGFVGMGNDPTPLQPEEVARILKRMESESPRINVTFRPGERVRIVDGPFEDFYGKVAEIDMERATVRVMVNFFGRETPVELDFLQVEPA